RAAHLPQLLGPAPQPSYSPRALSLGQPLLGPISAYLRPNYRAILGQKLNSVAQLIFSQFLCPRVSYQMKEDASDWWIDHRDRRPEAELHALTRSKFLPQSFWDRMEHEFYHLQQGSSKVDEYIRTFTRMCLFAGDAVNTDPKKAHKFLKGLNQRICELVGSHGLMSFADTVSRAQEVESCLISIAPVPSYYHASQPSQTAAQYAQPISSGPPGSSSGKRKSDYQNKKKGKKGNFGRRDDRPTQGQMPRCPKCGRFHTGECLADQRACYNYNRLGHYASVCTEPKRQQQ
ncbi:Unknown protein, partial [Striga hermonthica]